MMQPEHTPLIEFKNVSKRYDNHTAVNELNLTIYQGEFFVLVGGSGSGKSTTLRMINALTEPTDGDVYFNGRRIKDYDIRGLRHRIGYVLQQIALFPTMTVRQNIELMPDILGWDKSKRTSRVNELLELVGMPPETYLNRYPHELSGGEQQRIGILRAIAAKPDILLMDEPFSALDPLAPRFPSGNRVVDSQKTRHHHRFRYPRHERSRQTRLPHRRDAPRQAVAGRYAAGYSKPSSG